MNKQEKSSRRWLLILAGVVVFTTIVGLMLDVGWAGLFIGVGAALMLAAYKYKPQEQM